MGFKKFLGNGADKIEEAREVERLKEEEFENKVNDLLDKFEIPDIEKFLMRFLNNKPESEKIKDDDTGRTRTVRPGRKEYDDFIWEHLKDEEINYNHLKDFALKEKIVTPSFFGVESNIEYEKTDFQIIRNSIKADFEPEAITDKEYLEAQLMVFLKAKFSGKKIRRNVTIQGNHKIDMLIDDKYAFELKVPKGRSDLRKFDAQISKYREEYPNICLVIYDPDDPNLSQDIVDYVDKCKQDYGITSVILGGRRKR